MVNLVRILGTRGVSELRSNQPELEFPQPATVKSMSDNPGYGFIPSPSSPKKELPEVPKASPAVVNNYFTMAIDPQAVLLVTLLVILVIAIVRLGPVGFRA
jgi:hypothetical protein